MVATASMLWLIDGDDAVADLRQGLVIDRESATALAHKLFADGTLVPTGEAGLDRAASSADDEVYVGVFGRLAVIAGATLATTAPSALPSAVLAARPAATAHLIHTDHDASIGVFAQWDAGTLRRSFAANPVNIFEDEGIPFVFERDFWAGHHPLQYADGVPRDPQALPFHPVEFADHACREWLGLRLTRPWDGDVTPDRIPLSGFLIRPVGHQPTAEELAGRRHDPAQVETQAADPGVARSTASTDEPKPAGRLARFFGFGRNGS